MPRPFDVTTETTSTITTVHAAFGRRRYWLDRLKEYGGDSMSLDVLNVDPDGAVEVATSQDLRAEMVPAVFSRVLPRELKIIRTESWRPVGKELHGAATIAARGIPGSGAGTTVLKPLTSGSSLQFTGVVKVNIPLFGGRIEKYIVDLIAEEVPEMQRFTTEWISKNA